MNSKLHGIKDSILHTRVPGDDSKSSVSSYALLPIVLSFDYGATQLDLALDKQSTLRPLPLPCVYVREGALYLYFPGKWDYEKIGDFNESRRFGTLESTLLHHYDF